MPRSICTASLQRRLRLVGQVLLYGSVGTASSAVVYFLQDQIRQLHRLRQLLESKKRFADALRKHGISEASIQRMRKNTLEDHIQELERRGLVKLELVEEPPKWTSSPHKGEMYHIEYLPAKTARKKSYSRGIHAHSTHDLEIKLFKDIRGTLSHWWNEVATPIASNLKRHGRKIFMRKHWVDTINDGLHINHSERKTWTWPNRHGNSVLSISSGFQTSRRLFHMGRACYSQAPELNTNDPATVPEIGRASTAKQSLNPQLKSMLEEFSHQYLSDSPVVSDDAGLVVRLLTTHLRRYTAENRAEACDASLEIFQHMVEYGHIQAEAILSTLVNQDLVQHALNLYDLLPIHLIQTPSSCVIVLASSRLLAESGLYDETRKSRNRHTLLRIVARMSSAGLRDVWQHAASEGQLDPSILQPIIDSTILHFNHEVFTRLLISFEDTVIEDTVDNLILGSIKRQQNIISEAKFTQITAAIDHAALSGTSVLQAKLFSVAATAQYMLTAFSIFRVHNNFIPVDLETARLVGAAAMAEMHHCQIFQPGSIIRYFRRCDKHVTNAVLPHIAMQYLKSNERDPTLVENLKDIVSLMAPERAMAFLLSLPINENSKDADQNLKETVTEMKIDVLAKLAGKGGSDERVMQIYSAISTSISKAGQDLLPIRLAMMHASLSANRTALCASLAKEIYTEHEELHSSWRDMIQIMSALAYAGRPEECAAILLKLDANGGIPVELDQKLEFSTVFFHLATGCPDRWLEYAELWIREFGLFFGPKAFDFVVEHHIMQEDQNACYDSLVRLIRLSAQLPNDVGVRQKTITRAFIAFAKSDRLANRTSEGAHWYALFKKICHFNERIVTEHLVERLIDALNEQDKENQTVYRSGPRAFGLRRTTSGYARYRNTKLNLRKLILRTTLSRRKHSDMELEVVLRFVYPETTNEIFERRRMLVKELGAFEREMRSYVDSGLFAQAMAIFDSRLMSGLPINKHLLLVAAQACLSMNDILRAERLVETCKYKDMDTVLCQIEIARHKIINYDQTPEKMRLDLFEWYEQYASTHPESIHNLLVAAVVRLTASRRDRQRYMEKLPKSSAKDLMLEMHASKYAQQAPFGIREYTAFMAAYFHCKDYQGVSWVVATVLEKNLPISPAFVHLFQRYSSRVVRQAAKTSRHNAARKAFAVWRIMKAIVIRRRVAQRLDLQHHQKRIINILLHDAAHPDVDDEVHVTASRLRAKLDTRVTSQGHEANLYKIHLAKKARSEAVNAARIDSTTKWHSIHADAVDHHANIKHMDSDALNLLRIIAETGANQRKSGEKVIDAILRASPESIKAKHTISMSWSQKITAKNNDPLEMLQAMADAGNSKRPDSHQEGSGNSFDTFHTKTDASASQIVPTPATTSQGSLIGENMIPWSDTDTYILELLSKRVDDLRSEGRHDYDLLALAGELKVRHSRDLQGQDTAIEEMIRNEGNIPGTYGADKRVWKSVLERSGHNEEWEDEL